jgi:hypothetical protein
LDETGGGVLDNLHNAKGCTSLSFVILFLHQIICTTLTRTSYRARIWFVKPPTVSSFIGSHVVQETTDMIMIMDLQTIVCRALRDNYDDTSPSPVWYVLWAMRQVDFVSCRGDSDLIVCLGS